MGKNNAIKDIALKSRYSIHPFLSVEQEQVILANPVDGVSGKHTKVITGSRCSARKLKGDNFFII